MREILNGIRILFTPQDKWKLLGIVILLAIGTLLEIAGLGLLLPVVAIFTKPELFEQNYFLHQFKVIFSGLPERDFLLICCLLIALVYLLKNAWLTVTMYIYARFTCSRTADLKIRLYNMFLRTSYSHFVSCGRNEMNATLLKTEHIANMVMLPLMHIGVDVLTIIFIAGALLVTIPGVVAGCSLIFGTGTIIFYFLLRYMSSTTGRDINEILSQSSGLALYTLEDIRNIKVLGLETHFADIFRALWSRKGMKDVNVYMLGQLPRLVLEVLAVFSALAVLALMVISGKPVGTVILSFSLLVAAMARMLPAVSRINYSISLIRVGKPMFKDIMEAVNWEQENLEKNDIVIKFEHEIRCRNINFGYEEGKPVFKDFSMVLPKNSSLAVTGPTGSGKSTLIDLLLGLYKPQSGTIESDGTDIHSALGSWRKLIGLVPQNIVLTQGSVASNVALGIPEKEIDFARVREVLETAQLLEFIDSLPEKTDTLIGENGIRLSGGQRQRLGIARALYRDPEIIILDEATSALDMETEQAFIDALEQLRGRKTMIMIAHRLSTIEKCDLKISI